jgi:hypothetical protein
MDKDIYCWRKHQNLSNTIFGKLAGGGVFLFLNTNNLYVDYKYMMSVGITFISESKEQDYGRVTVFADLYGNLWDLLQLKPDYPVSVRTT